MCRIPIENILAVERLEEESFKMKNVRDNVAHTHTHVYCTENWLHHTAVRHCILIYM